MKASYRDEIRSISEDRDVQFLLHFTQAANLAEIVKHGLLSRIDLAASEQTAYTSDRWRLDENDKAISVSISRTNNAMFSSKRIKSGNPYWVVLVLSSEILWTHDCRFYWSNAANSELKNKRGWLGGPWAYGKMFSGGNEARSGHARCFPTYRDAEVQVMERIAPKYIKGAIVDRQEAKDPVRAIMNDLPDAPLPVIVENFDLL